MNTEQTNLTTTETAPATTPATTPRARPVTWLRPSVDVFEKGDELVLVLDVPGVPADALEIRAEGARLTVQGVRAGSDRGWHRVFSIPNTVDAERIEARAENGVLTLTLPRSEASKPRKIEVRQR
jgi:HSP20 family molecular chaperone IbpA